MLNLLISGKFFENECVYKDIQIITFRRKQLTEVLYKENALKNFLIFTGADFCWSLFEITLRHGCSPVYLLHIFRTPSLKNTSGRLLLDLLLESYHWLHSDIDSMFLLFLLIKHGFFLSMILIFWLNNQFL